MKFIRNLAQSVNEIIGRLEILNVVPSETLVLITEATFKGFTDMGSNVQVEKEDPITRMPYPVPITRFNLYTIYTVKTVPIMLGDKTEWTAITSIQTAQSPAKTFSSAKAGNLVLIELNDSRTDMISLEIDGM